MKLLIVLPLLILAGLATSQDRIRVRWYEFYTPVEDPPQFAKLVLVQSGEVKETSAANVHYFMPSISMSTPGDIAMVMSKSGSAGPVADIVRTARSQWALGSPFGEPLGTMGAPEVLKSSGGPTYGTPGFNRWGNYSAVCVDPADNGTFWVIHMTGDAGSNWTTEISSFGVSPVLTSVTLPATVKGTFSVDWIVGSFTTNVEARDPRVGANWEFGRVSSSNRSLIDYGYADVATGRTTGIIRLKLIGTVYAPTVVTITVTLNGVSVSKDITVVPADPELSLSVSTVAANQSVIGRVSLSVPAGSGGQVVNLTSSDPIAVLGPTALEWEHHSITIPAGQLIGKFGISTANALSTRTSDITATWGSTSLTKTLTVLPSPALSSLKIAGTKVVVGGESTTCVVRILAAAPDGGARAKLLETSDAVVPDIFANIKAGQKLGTATIRTTPVTNTEIVVITARMNGTNKTDTLTVIPPAVGDLTLSVPTVAANQSAIGTVTLLSSAGPSGEVVELTSSDPVAVLGPTALEWAHHSITIPAGARTGKFGISTASTLTTKTSEITATLGTTSVTRTLTVIPSPGLSSLVIAGAKTVVGGQSTTCVVQVLAAAPDGGARVKLLESSDFVTPDIFANIPAGLNTGSATIKTSPVTTTQVVVITARLNDVTKTDTLTVTP